MLTGLPQPSRINDLIIKESHDLCSDTAVILSAGRTSFFVLPPSNVGYTGFVDSLWK